MGELTIPHKEALLESLKADHALAVEYAMQWREAGLKAENEVIALRRELEAEKARFEEHHAAWLENHKYLAGRVRELEVDAARYRWLRDKSEHAKPVNGYMTWPVTGHDHTDAHPVFGADLDAAIDAARAADAGERRE